MSLFLFLAQNPTKTFYYTDSIIQICFLKDFIIYFREGKGGRKRERNSNLWLPLKCPLLRTWPTTQACALPGKQTSDTLVHRPVLNPLSHTSQGILSKFVITRYIVSTCFQFSLINLLLI